VSLWETNQATGIVLLKPQSVGSVRPQNLGQMGHPKTGAFSVSSADLWGFTNRVSRTHEPIQLLGKAQK